MQQARALAQTMITLASSSLGLVAALAWNDAIKAAMHKALGNDESVGGLLVYATTATVLAILVLAALARFAARVGGEARITREAD